MRKSCLDCVRKHIAQASVLCDEAELGYPHHRWLAVGHLAEAESESLKDHPALSHKIRECRLDLMNRGCVNFDELLILCCETDTGKKMVFDPENSKKFNN